MDATITTNNIAIPQPQINNEDIKATSQENAEITNPAHKNAPEKMKVMMDLEEVQDFLFMLIGSENPVKISEDFIGNNINILA